MKMKRNLDVWQIISFVILALYALFLVLPLFQLLVASVVNEEGQFTWEFFSRFFGKLHLRVVKLHVRIGAKDAMTAAVIYGLANQAVQYTMEFLRKFCRVDKYSQSDIRIEPDFLIEDIAFAFDLNVRVTLGGMLGAIFKAGWKFLVGFMRIKPDPNHPKPSVKPPKAPKPEPAPLPDAPEPRS